MLGTELAVIIGAFRRTDWGAKYVGKCTLVQRNARVRRRNPCRPGTYAENSSVLKKQTCRFKARIVANNTHAIVFDTSKPNMEQKICA